MNAALLILGVVMVLYVGSSVRFWRRLSREDRRQGEGKGNPPPGR